MAAEEPDRAGLAKPRMSALITIWDGGGNVAPQLGIARALVERGHDVRVLGNSCQRDRVERTGARFLPYRHAPDTDSSRPETDLLRDWEAKTPIGAFGRLRDNLMYGPALEFARDVVEVLEDEPADVVGWDYLLVGTGIGAEAARVPAAALVHTVYPVPAEGVPPFGLGLQPAGGGLGRVRDAVLGRGLSQMFRPGLKAANRARSELRLPPWESPFEAITGVDRLLVLTSPEFDFASRADLPGHVRYTGPVRDAAGSAAWESPWPAGDERPLVVASFSTTFMDQSGLAARAVEALSGLPVRGLITTGPAIDPASLPRAANVEVRGFVPHSAVLPEASAAITHAGLGTVHASLAAGVPMVCLPDGRDQPENAARVVHHGAGLRAGPGASAAKLRKLVERILGDPSFKRSAERLAEAFAREDGAARAADELEAIAG
jgi:MGT family glycosyltransferase